MEASKLFTFKIILCDKSEILMKNLTAEQLNAKRKNMWVDGVLKKTNEMTAQIISPFTISEAWIIQQTEEQ